MAGRAWYVLVDVAVVAVVVDILVGNAPAVGLVLVAHSAPAPAVAAVVAAGLVPDSGLSQVDMFQHRTPHQEVSQYGLLH